jgi:hypothetical protein
MKPIPNFPNYFVDEHGIVYTGQRGILCELKPRTTRDGYIIVRLWRDGKRHAHTVGSLVLQAYVGPRPTAPRLHHAAHLNGIRTDNRLVNLEWKCPALNGQDKIRHRIFEEAALRFAPDKHSTKQLLAVLGGLLVEAFGHE